MPSGAKKRKAARRKKEGETEMEQGLVHPPDSSTDAPPDNSLDGKVNTRSSTSSSSSTSSDDDEEKQEERKEPPSEDTINMEKTAKADDDGNKVEEVAVPVSTEAGFVRVEFVQAEKSDVAVEESAAAAAEAATVASVPADEEIVEAAAAAAGTLDTSLETDSLSHETEVKPAPILVEEETPVAGPPRDGGELCHDTETSEPTPVPLAEHRGSWWNCCGLFDVLKGSKDNIRTSA